MRKRKVFGWILFIVGVLLIRGVIVSTIAASSMPGAGELNYAIVALWVVLLFIIFYGWYRLALRKR